MLVHCTVVDYWSTQVNDTPIHNITPANHNKVSLPTATYVYHAVESTSGPTATLWPALRNFRRSRNYEQRGSERAGMAQQLVEALQYQL